MRKINPYDLNDVADVKAKRKKRKRRDGMNPYTGKSK